MCAAMLGASQSTSGRQGLICLTAPPPCVVVMLCWGLGVAAVLVGAPAPRKGARLHPGPFELARAVDGVGERFADHGLQVPSFFQSLDRYLLLVDARWRNLQKSVSEAQLSIFPVQSTVSRAREGPTRRRPFFFCPGAS